MKKREPKPEVVTPEDVDLIEETAKEIESKRERYEYGDEE